jgi:hypothetical protein
MKMGKFSIIKAREENAFEFIDGYLDKYKRLPSKEELARIIYLAPDSAKRYLARYKKSHTLKVEVVRVNPYRDDEKYVQ